MSITITTPALKQGHITTMTVFIQDAESLVALHTDYDALRDSITFTEIIIPQARKQPASIKQYQIGNDGALVNETEHAATTVEICDTVAMFRQYQKIAEIQPA